MNTSNSLEKPEVKSVDVPTFDAQGALSREFLLQRGFCCKNGCRNCPYGFRRRGEEN